MSNFNLQLPQFAQTISGGEVLSAFSTEFAQTWDLIRAYNTAVEVSQNNGSFIQFQIALWSDLMILGLRLSEFAFQWWRIASKETERA
jgi:hypothetical protein